MLRSVITVKLKAEPSRSPRHPKSSRKRAAKSSRTPRPYLARSGPVVDTTRGHNHRHQSDPTPELLFATVTRSGGCGPCRAAPSCVNARATRAGSPRKDGLPSCSLQARDRAVIELSNHA